MKSILVAAVSSALALSVAAAERTVVLSVPTMDCPACPITLKLALGKVPGVIRTEVDYEKRLATVTFNDARTQVEALARATMEAGFLSKPVATAK